MKNNTRCSAAGCQGAETDGTDRHAIAKWKTIVSTPTGFEAAGFGTIGIRSKTSVHPSEKAHYPAPRISETLVHPPEYGGVSTVFQNRETDRLDYWNEPIPGCPGAAPRRGGSLALAVRRAVCAAVRLPSGVHRFRFITLRSFVRVYISVHSLVERSITGFPVRSGDSVRRVGLVVDGVLARDSGRVVGEATDGIRIPQPGIAQMPPQAASEFSAVSLAVGDAVARHPDRSSVSSGLVDVHHSIEVDVALGVGDVDVCVAE